MQHTKVRNCSIIIIIIIRTRLATFVTLWYNCFLLHLRYSYANAAEYLKLHHTLRKRICDTFPY
jgi:hypothetical protein